MAEVEQGEKRSGVLEFFQNLGLSLTNSTQRWIPNAWIVALMEGSDEQMKRLTSAGIPRTDVEVKIVDEKDHNLPPGQMGKIVVRGEVVMKGYWRNPEATAETLRGGWLHTGDLGVMDEKGYVYILDRAKDMIISGGENIYSREIEDVILKHSAVLEVAVIGVPDEKWGEAVRAIVSLKEGQKATEEEIINFCKEQLEEGIKVTARINKKPEETLQIGKPVKFLRKNNLGYWFEL